MINDFGYLVGFNRSTHKCEVLSTKVHRVAAESFVAVEATLHEQTTGGIHDEYYCIGFVSEFDMRQVESLIEEYNEDLTRPQFGFIFLIKLI